MAALTTAQLKARMAVIRGPVVDTAHDFTAMTSTQVLAAYELSSFGSDRYAPQADGSYILRESDDAPVTNLGIVVDGAFVNYAVNGVLAGAVAGSPGTLPTGWDIHEYTTKTAVAVETHLGLPALFVTVTTNSENRSAHLPRNNYAIPGSGYFSGSMFAWYDISLDATDEYTKLVSKYSYNTLQTALLDGWNHYSLQKLARDPADSLGFLSPCPTFAASGSACTLGAAGVQLVTLPLCPNTLALSSDTTTAKLADIIQRAVDLRGPFAVELVATTGPGDPGYGQQILCLSKDANTRINVSRYTSTNLVRVNSEVAGSSVVTTGTTVGNNTQTVVRMQVEFNRCRVSVGGNAPVTISKARADTYILNTLGSDYNGTSSFWGSIQSFRILENYIATDDELENGFAI